MHYEEHEHYFVNCFIEFNKYFPAGLIKMIIKIY